MHARAASESVRARTIEVRAPRFAFDDAPGEWLATDPVATAVVDALSLIFPEGERMFIRSVKHYEPRIHDPELRRQVRAFFGQEGRHGHEHERWNRVLQRRDASAELFRARYEHAMYTVIEPRVPPALRLATTVALEHMTATLAEAVLTLPLLDDAHPGVAALLRWHAAEEIEHKSVAFDVLVEVDPRYSTRMAGLGMASAVLLGSWGLGISMLLRGRRAAGATLRPADPRAARRFARTVGPTLRFVASELREYMRPSFHPDQRDNYALAERVFESLEPAPTPRAAQRRG